MSHAPTPQASSTQSKSVLSSTRVGLSRCTYELSHVSPGHLFTRAHPFRFAARARRGRRVSNFLVAHDTLQEDLPAIPAESAKLGKTWSADARFETVLNLGKVVTHGPLYILHTTHPSVLYSTATPKPSSASLPTNRANGAADASSSQSLPVWGDPWRSSMMPRTVRQVRPRLFSKPG